MATRRKHASRPGTQVPGLVVSPPRILLVAGVFLALGFGLRAIGVHLSPDSVEYLSMARSLAAGEGAQGFDGEPSGIWPPGFSMVLAGVVALGADPVRWLPWIHAALWTILLTAVLLPLARDLRGSPWRVALVLGCTLGAPVVTVTSSLVADAFLVALVLAGLRAAERVREGDDGRGLVTLTVCAALAPLFKPLGAMLWPALAWALVGPIRGGRSRRALLAAAVAVLPCGLWVARNLLHFGVAVEGFPGEPRPFGVTVRRTLEHVARWILPQVDSTDVLLLSAAVVLLGAGGWWWRHDRRGPSSRSVPWILTAVGYLVLLCGGSVVQKVDLPNARLLAPLFVIVVVLLARAGDRLLPTQRGWSRAAVVIAALWAAWTLVAGARAAEQHLFVWGRSNYTQEGPVAAAMESFAPAFATQGDPGAATDPIWSNVPEFVHWHTGHRSQWTQPEDLAPVLATPGRRLVLVWFTRSVRDGLWTPQELATWVRWEQREESGTVQLWTGTVVDPRDRR